MTASLSLARGALDGFAYADIGAAAANIARHRRIDIAIVGMWILGEQGRRRHDLPRLAVAALNHFVVQPGLLHLGARFARADSFNCYDGATVDRRDRKKT